MQVLRTENYGVSFNPGDNDRLIISVSSLGYVKLDRYEQFWGGLKKTRASALFVADIKGLWFNHVETEEVFREVARIASRFASVAIIGDSMGGSGAILLSNYVTNASRVVAFAPQFSVATPFIEFDVRYRDYASKFKNLYFDNFGYSNKKHKCLLLFGNTVWMDMVHQSMFRTLGFPIITVDKAPHEVAKFLHERDRLQALFDAVGDFSVPFTLERASEILGELVGEPVVYHLTVASGVKETFVEDYSNVNLPVTPICPLISVNCSANQSSVSRWSFGSTTKEDAVRATRPLTSDDYSFHTSFEMEPWWEVDLGDDIEVEELRFYNRLGDERILRRANVFAIDAYDRDNGTYFEVFSKLSRFPVIGQQGRPFRWRPQHKLVTCRLRIRLHGWGALHLRTVEVYGTSPLQGDPSLGLSTVNTEPNANAATRA